MMYSRALSICSNFLLDLHAAQMRSSTFQNEHRSRASSRHTNTHCKRSSSPRPIVLLDLSWA